MVVPDPRATQRLRSELELLSDLSMPGTERHKIGDWTLRYGVGATGRANSVWPNGDPRVTITAAIQQVEMWYGSKAQPSRFQIFDGPAQDLITPLADHGYVEVPGALVMWAPINKINLVATELPPGWIVKRSPTIEPAMAEAIGEPGRVKEISVSSLAVEFVSVFDSSGRFLGGGKAAAAGSSIGIFAMLTVPESRRMGVASHVVKQLLDNRTVQPDGWAWLQVSSDNTEAISLYSRLGFETVHKYVYMSRDVTSL